MQNYINILPEEIITLIYKKVYTSCLNEIKSSFSCCMCNRIIFVKNVFNVSYSNCKNCCGPVCYHCWNTYCTNYGRGWKPYLGHCKHCAIEKIKTEGFSNVVYPN